MFSIKIRLIQFSSVSSLAIFLTSCGGGPPLRCIGITNNDQGVHFRLPDSCPEDPTRICILEATDVRASVEVNSGSPLLNQGQWSTTNGKFMLTGQVNAFGTHTAVANFANRAGGPGPGYFSDSTLRFPDNSMLDQCELRLHRWSTYSCNGNSSTAGDVVARPVPALSFSFRNIFALIRWFRSDRLVEVRNVAPELHCSVSKTSLIVGEPFTISCFAYDPAGLWQSSGEVCSTVADCGRVRGAKARCGEQDRCEFVHDPLEFTFRVDDLNSTAMPRASNRTAFTVNDNNKELVERTHAFSDPGVHKISVFVADDQAEDSLDIFVSVQDGTRFVDSIATGPKSSGADWNNAFRDLQSALANARTLNSDADPSNDVEQILVGFANQTPYRPSASDQNVSFDLVPGVNLIGGFQGAQHPSCAGVVSCRELDRDWRDFPTVLSGDLSGNDAGDSGLGENSLHVVTAIDVGATTGIDGFVIEGGNANGSLAQTMTAYASLLSGGTFVDPNRGGGLYVAGSPSIRRCKFRRNRSVFDGGGMRLVNGAAVNGNPQIELCEFIANEAGGFGGGLSIQNFDGDPVPPRIARSVFRDNTSFLSGGGCDVDGDAILDNVQLYRNFSTEAGGALSVFGHVVVNGATACGNSAGLGGGLSSQSLAVSDGIDIRSSILWGNGDGGASTDTVFDQVDDGGGSNVQVRFTTVQGLDTKVGNTFGLYLDGSNKGDHPRFADDCCAVADEDCLGRTPINSAVESESGGMVAAGSLLPLDLSPQLNSPALESGSRALALDDISDADGDGDLSEPMPFDSDGKLRVIGRELDMGALESHPVWTEVDDAGYLPGTAQVVATNGLPLALITGSLVGESPGVDMYVIQITDPDGFSASTNGDSGGLGGGATFDTQLWLLSASGAGIVANDDSVFERPYHSAISLQTTDGTDAPSLSVGPYLLAVSAFDTDPQGATGRIFSQARFTEISGPDGGGVPSDIVGWNEENLSAPGNYSIFLTGASGVMSAPLNEVAVTSSESKSPTWGRDAMGPVQTARAAGDLISLSQPDPTLPAILSAGVPVTIGWTSDEPSGFVEIHLTKNGALHEFIARVAASVGTYEWTPCESIGNANEYRIRLRQCDWKMCESDSSEVDLTIENSIGRPIATLTSFDTEVGDVAIGSVQQVTWSHTGGDEGAVKIELLSGDESILLGTEPLTAHSFEWTVCNTTLGLGSDFRIRLAVCGCGACAEDMSTDPFGITGATDAWSFQVDSPISGDRWSAADSQTIRWSVPPDPSGLIQIELLRAGALVEVIGEAPVSDGESAWQICERVGSGRDFRIRLTRCDCGSCVSQQSGRFAITDNLSPPGLAIGGPMSGSFAAGSDLDIQWSAGSGAQGDVAIALKRDGESFRVLGTAPVADQAFHWTIPQNLGYSDAYAVEVSLCNCGSCTTSTGGVFSVTGSMVRPTIELNPFSALPLIGGETVDISWTSTAPLGDVDIYLIKGGEVEDRLAVVPMSTGRFSWTLCEDIRSGPNYAVVISQCTDTCIDSVSEEFAIVGSPSTPSMTLNHPVTADVWPAGTSRAIEWTTGAVSGEVVATLFRDGADLGRIGVGDPTDGFLVWDLPSYLEAGNDYQVELSLCGCSGCISDRTANGFEVSNSAGTPSPLVTDVNADGPWSPGKVVMISWSVANPSGDVAVVLHDAGVAVELLDVVPMANGTASWLVCDYVGSGDQFTVAVISIDVESNRGDSPAFSIQDSFPRPELSFDMPLSGVAPVFIADEVVPVTWNSEFARGEVMIELRKNGKHSAILGSVPMSEGLFDWTVCGFLESGDDYAIRLSQCGCGPCIDVVSNAFAIQADLAPVVPTLVLDEPVGVVDWSVGLPGHTIRWTPENPAGNVNIFLLKDGGLNSFIGNVPMAAGEFHWTICDSIETGSNYSIEVTSECSTLVGDESDRTLSISGGMGVLMDSDADGVSDSCDNCPGTPNFSQQDVNGDGIGDACQGDSVVDFEFQCVAVETPSIQNQAVALPASVTDVAIGQPLYIEFWATDSGTTNTGLVSTYADMEFSDANLSCESLANPGLFDLFTSGSCDGLRIDELGGSQLSGEVGIEPEWALVSQVQFRASALGRADICMAPASSESSGHNRGLVPQSKIRYGCCSADIVGCPCIYDLDNNCTVAGGDLGLFAGCWSCCDSEPCWQANSCEEMDFDCSGCVSGGDLGWFAGVWRETCAALDSIAGNPVCRECAGAVICALANQSELAEAITSRSIAPDIDTLDDGVELAYRLTSNPTGQRVLDGLIATELKSIGAGEHLFAEIWVRDNGPYGHGLTAVFADLQFDRRQFEFVSVIPGEDFTLFSGADLDVEASTIRHVGGATMDAGVGVGSWVLVSSVELRTIGRIESPNLSLLPAGDEPVSRRGMGLVPGNRINVTSMPDYYPKPRIDHRRGTRGSR